MNRDLGISKEVSARAAGRHPVPRWRIVLIALTLALAIGSTSRTPPAQAAPAAAKWELYMAVDTGNWSPAEPICVEDHVDFNVRILGSQVNDSEEAPLTPKITLLGIAVDGILEDPGKGTLSPSNATITAGNVPPDSARFTFIAREAGTARVSFDAKVKTSWFGPFSSPKDGIVKNYVDIEIEDCKYKVTTIGEWRVPGPANTFISATSDDAEVKAADPQGPFTGTATVNWAGSVGRVRDCSGTLTIGSSQVSWNGNRNRGGQLTLNGNYQSATASFDADCAGGEESTSGSMQVDMTPDPVQVSFGSSGGVFRQTQVLEGPEATPGHVTIIVVPEKDQAAAFHPSEHETSWDDFFSIFGMQLALH